MLNKKTIKIIVIGLSSAFLITASILLVNYFAFGKIAVTLANSGVSYQIDESPTVYSQDSLISWARPGKHQIQAFGTNKNDYTSKTFEVNVRAGETATLDVALEPTSSNPDFSPAELDPNGTAAQKLADQMPVNNSFGSFYFDYSDSQFHVDLATGVSRASALSWFQQQGVKIEEVDIIWGDFVPPDGN